MSKSFGSEIGLVHQIIMLAAKLGGDERLWKMLVNDHAFLTYVVDYAAMVCSEGTFCYIGDHGVMVKLVCFSQTEWVTAGEVWDRVDRFARYATDKEMQALAVKLQAQWDEADCPPLRYPIIACDPQDVANHPESFLALTYGASPAGRPELLPQAISKQRKKAGGELEYAPGTHFAVVRKDGEYPHHVFHP